MASRIEDLVVSGAEMDQSLVAEVLSPYVRLDSTTKSIRPLDRWESLDNAQRVLVFAIARKAMKSLSWIESESAGPSEISRATGIKEGTVAPLVRKLGSKRLLDQDSDRKYFLPNHALPKVKQLILNSDEEAA